MPIPTFDKLLRPVLDLANREDITRRSATAAMVREFKLSPSEIEQRIPSGSATVIRNRIGWAMTFLTKGGLISKIAPKTYRATDLGREFLSQHPIEIAVPDLKAIPGWEEAWNTRRKRREGPVIGQSIAPSDSTATPQEKIAREVTALDTDLRDRLLTAIVEQPPAFFERLVLDVLIAMGYGGSREDAAEHLGRSFGEGLLARMTKNEARARTAFEAARARQETIVQAQPDYGPTLCVLGLIDAALGRKDLALAEGLRAISLTPLEKDAINGSYVLQSGDKELALQQLEGGRRAAQASEMLSYGALKLFPIWDPIRDDPRFEKIVASLTPKEPSK
jgi:restriction endonuclease Mrr